MVCPFCGTALADDAVQCNACGATRNAPEKTGGGAWVPYVILGAMTAVGFAVFLLTKLF